MKNPSNVLRNISLAAVFTFFFVPATVLANDTKPVLPVDITYVGSVDYKPIFQISFDNQEANDVNLLLRDESGNIIYTEVVKQGKYSRKIQLENIDRNAKVTLTLRSKKGTQSQAFYINKNTRIVEEVVVVKVQ